MDYLKSYVCWTNTDLGRNNNDFHLTSLNFTRYFIPPTLVLRQSTDIYLRSLTLGFFSYSIFFQYFTLAFTHLCFFFSFSMFLSCFILFSLTIVYIFIRIFLISMLSFSSLLIFLFTFCLFPSLSIYITFLFS